MEAKKDEWKKLQGAVPAKTDAKAKESAPVSPVKHHSTHGEAESTDAPTLRTATTDSSRSPKNPNDERPTGGNIR
ncbi:hypothetical protein ACXYMU_00495 [Pontibacter sp. CAU 1760]